MSKSKQFASTIGVAVAAAMLLTASAFADSRHRNETWRDRDRYDLSSRDHQRVTFEGRIRSVNYDRDGYRLQLDRGAYSFWVPLSVVDDRARDFRVGASVRLAGVFRGGYVYVDDVDWPRGDYYRYDRYGHGRGIVRGYIDRVDYRRGTLSLRDELSGRYVTVDIDRGTHRSGRRGSRDDLRRGDYVVVSGSWLSRSVFEAYRIDDVRRRRY